MEQTRVEKICGRTKGKSLKATKLDSMAWRVLPKEFPGPIDGMTLEFLAMIPLRAVLAGGGHLLAEKIF